MLKSIKLKNKMYKQFLLHPSNYQFDKYKRYRNVLNRAIEGEKRNYYSKVVTEEKHNSEKLYQIINKICKLKIQNVRGLFKKYPTFFPLANKV